MKAIRTWKRDGSTNVMFIWDAAENIKKNVSDKYSLRTPAKEIVDRLKRGEVIETRHASFQVCSANGDRSGK